MTANGSLRVAFILLDGHWLGGKNYLRNLFAAISTLPGGKVAPVIFTGSRNIGVSADFPGVEVVTSSILDRRSVAGLGRRVLAKAGLRDDLLRRLLKRHHISVLSHSFHLGVQSAIKTVGWIPDFQHVHLPEFFTPQERLRRDREFKSVCTRCDKVIVSSEDARADLAAFAPEHAHKAELLHFVAAPAPAQTGVRMPELSSLYGFEAPFFLLPNQFWAHKNHAVVLRALQLLKEQGVSATVVATGATHDYRQPGFFSQLMRLAAECGVTEDFKVPGVIPYDHLVGLMREAVAFINPSRFEGWSTSVEEAKSMGKAILLSDIPVHREQAPERGVFFDANDPSALAAGMRIMLQQFDSEFDRAMQERAKGTLDQRQRAFGERYARIIEAALFEKPN